MRHHFKFKFLPPIEPEGRLVTNGRSAATICRRTLACQDYDRSHVDRSQAFKRRRTASRTAGQAPDAIAGSRPSTAVDIKRLSRRGCCALW
jgi:hypothetical protein